MYESTTTSHEYHHHQLEDNNPNNNNTACISSLVTEHPCPPRVSIQQLYYETEEPKNTDTVCPTSILNVVPPKSNNHDNNDNEDVPHKRQERLVRIMGCVVSYTNNNNSNSNSNNSETKNTTPTILTIDDGTGLLQVQCPLQMIHKLVGQSASSPTQNNQLSSKLIGQTLDCIGSIQQTRVTTVPQLENDPPPPKEHPHNNNNNNNNNKSTSNDPRWFLHMMADTLIFISSNDPNLQTLRWFQMYHHDNHMKNVSSFSYTPPPPPSSCSFSLLPTTIIPTKHDVLRLIKECGKNAHGAQQQQQQQQQQDGPTLDELLLVLGMDCDDDDDDNHNTHQDTSRSTILRHMLQEMQGDGDIYISRQGTYLPL